MYRNAETPRRIKRTYLNVEGMEQRLLLNGAVLDAGLVAFQSVEPSQEAPDMGSETSPTVSGNDAMGLDALMSVFANFPAASFCGEMNGADLAEEMLPSSFNGAEIGDF